MKYCKDCGEPNKNSAEECISCGSDRFEYHCLNCGTVFENSSSCPKCGAPAGKKKKVCPKCGEVYFSKTCPNCGYTQGNTKKKKKKKTFRLIALIIAAVIIIGAVIFGITKIIGSLSKKTSASNVPSSANSATTSTNNAAVANNTDAGSASVDNNQQNNNETKDYLNIETDDFVFRVKSIDPKGLWGYTLNAYIENKTDRNLFFTVEDEYIDGYNVGSFWGTDLSAGKKSNESICYSLDDQDGIDKNNIKEIEFRLLIMNKVGDSEYDFENAVYNEILKFNP